MQYDSAYRGDKDKRRLCSGAAYIWRGVLTVISAKKRTEEDNGITRGGEICTSDGVLRRGLEEHVTFKQVHEQ